MQVTTFALNYLTHVTNALLLVGPDRNVRF